MKQEKQTQDGAFNIVADNEAEGTSNERSKRPKLTFLSSSKMSQIEARKEKFGDRITALQQLVSPFGKTDTASILLEAIGYIKFLQEQVQVLSSPYMKPINSHQSHCKESGEGVYELRSRGLCLVPVSCTMHVADSNGADFWASGFCCGGSR